MPTPNEFARMAFFVSRHGYTFKLDKLCRVVHVAVEEWDCVSESWFDRWHECRSFGHLRDLLGY